MKILVFGMVASGKTTLAKNISKKYNIPHFEGDNIAWDGQGAKREKRTFIQQKEIIEKINKDNWVIDGTYREEQKILFEMAEHIIYLDTPLHIRRYRIIKRYIRQKLSIEKANYVPSLKMLRAMFRWTKDYEKNKRKYQCILEKYNDKIIHLKKNKIRSLEKIKGELQ